jgi:peptidoglycan pentaglycine glycine transferase (the first glycine)
MRIIEAQNRAEWENFLQSQEWSPFLQSWNMGEVYESLGQEVIRLEVRDEGEIVGVCQGVVVPARRGKHIAVQYGPLTVVRDQCSAIRMFVEELKRIAVEKKCVFVRMSPFWINDDLPKELGFRDAPLHMLAEHIWYLNLDGKTEEEILAGMRKNTRNLIRRSEREGVIVEVSDDPVRDMDIFLKLHEETRKRHKFVPYSDKFFEAQVDKFKAISDPRSAVSGAVMYIARLNGEPVSASIHMTYGGETSYHHGASTSKYPKCYASYLLQWTAIRDALKRGDKIFNFWGVSPEGVKKHPFAGVRTFKTGFGGELLELVHCKDIAVSKKYWLNFAIENLRKWRRGF